MKQVSQVHKSEYDCEPQAVAVCPGRFHLAGEHSWFFKDKTLSMAVNLPVYIAVSQRNDSSLRFFFVQLKERKKSGVATMKFRREDKWANAIKAVIFGFESCGIKFGGLNFTVWSDILPSAGFGRDWFITVSSLRPSADWRTGLLLPRCFGGLWA